MKIVRLFPNSISCEARLWKLSLITLLSAFLACPLRAQAPPAEPPPPLPQNAPQKLSQEDLNSLLAPIALYPDALIALMLPASTVPSDLVLAERYIASNGDPAQITDQPIGTAAVSFLVSGARDGTKIGIAGIEAEIGIAATMIKTGTTGSKTAETGIAAAEARTTVS